MYVYFLILGKPLAYGSARLGRICETLNCEITDVIELVSDEPASTGGKEHVMILSSSVKISKGSLSPMSKLLRSSIGNVILPNESSFLTIPVLCITYSPLWRSVYFLFYFLMTCCLCNVFVMTVVYHRAIHLSTKKWKVFFKMLGGVQTVILKFLLHFAVIFSF